MDVLKLIDCMRSRAPLWNRMTSPYSARETKKQLWKEVVALTGATEDEVRRKWKSLNDVFRREHTKYLHRRRRDPNAQPPHWRYYSQMLFMEQQIGMRFQAHRQRLTADAAKDDDWQEGDDASITDSSLGCEELPRLAIKMELPDEGEDAAAYVECLVKEEELESVCGAEGGIADPTGDAAAAVDYTPAAKRARITTSDKQPKVAKSCHSQQSSGRGAASASRSAAASNCCNKKVTPVRVFFAARTSDTNTITREEAEETAAAASAAAVDDAQQHVDEVVVEPSIKELLEHVQQQQHVDDDDYHFALSLVPAMRGLSTQRKMWLRMKIQLLLWEAVRGGECTG